MRRTRAARWNPWSGGLLLSTLLYNGAPDDPGAADLRAFQVAALEHDVDGLPGAAEHFGGFG